jgi:hypothetical protein
MAERISTNKASNKKNAENMTSKFSRHVENGLINKLKAEDLWVKKLETDCGKRDVFLAIRPGYVSFYHKGGGLFTFDNKGFYTNVKYSVLMDKTDYKRDYIYETSLHNVQLIDNFIDGYDNIKKNCKKYSENSEAEGVSRIYHKYPYNSGGSDVVVLDIEVAFSEQQKEDERKQNRIDLLLYNKKLEELLFIEAKKFDNDEIRAKDSHPPVIDQIERYQDTIKEKSIDILPTYQEYVNTLNKIFSGLNLPAPNRINDKIGLLIFDFDDDQKKGKLANIEKNLKAKNIPYYSIGDIKGINAETLWGEIKKKMK